MDETGTVYTGAPVIEFAHLAGTLNVIYATSRPAVFTDSVKIQLVGPQRTTPTTVTFEVDPSSTGVNGVDYTKLTHTGNTAVIPANESFVWLKYRFTKPAAGSKTLKLNLLSGDNVGLSQNFKTITFTWVK
jgi:hypothetical protein